jgi:hypothetical protein
MIKSLHYYFGKAIHITVRLPWRIVSFPVVSQPSLLVAFFCTFFIAPAMSQPGLWTWMKGDSTNQPAGNFGTQGIPSPLNKPPGFYEPAEWKDKQNRLWFYGGFNYFSGASDNIWQYDIQTNEWTWIKGGGVGIPNPVYGTQGVFAPGNTPGNEQWCAASWVDTSGKFWLFGGSDGSGSSYNLLWQYDPAINQWALMKGSTTSGNLGSYGTKGVPSPNNNPPSRWETNASWTDAENNLWLFGGYRGAYLNDLWKYDIANNEWTWMSGSNLTGQVGIYGTQGIPAAANIPGGRFVYTKWKDTDGNLWLFGGNGLASTSSPGVLNDLWRYDLSGNEWTWMSGSNLANNPGVTGPLCELSPNYYPSGRYEARSCWRDLNGNFWLYGGLGVLSESNDLWVYVPDSNAWAIVSTSNIASGLYGTQGIPSINTHPPTKMGALGWTDSIGNLWLFNGGFLGAAIMRNDLWKYEIDLSCPLLSQAPVSSFLSSDTFLCEKFCIDFFDQSTNDPFSWFWEFPGGIPATSTDQNPTNICYDNPGQYDVTLITTNADGTDTLTLINFVSVFATPPIPVITQNGNTLTSTIAAFYQWQFNSIDIAGATNQSYSANQTGYYTVVVSDSNGCVNSTTLYIDFTGITELPSGPGFSIYPNPARTNLVMELSAMAGNSDFTIEIRNLIGQKSFP